MTKNAFIFSWDCNGIESIIPISKYEHWDKENLIRLLKEQSRTRNPLDSIVHNLILRARVNTQRRYEIYAIDCDPSLDEEFWRRQWEEHPQFTADLIREKGHKIYSDRQTTQSVIT
jgi:hypothetical protein